MIKTLPGKVLVKVLDRYAGDQNKLKLVLVDKKKHFDGVRRGEVQAVGSGVHGIRVGDVVVFRGSAGVSFDVDERGANDGIGWRSLSQRECMAVEEGAEVSELAAHAGGY